MNASVDSLRAARTRVNWSRINPAGPGLHQPKKKGDVGWDIECAETTRIPPGEAIDIPTNVRLELPPGMWAEIRARSSIARRGLQVDAGTIDNGYRGPIFALVRNMQTLKPNELFVPQISEPDFDVDMDRHDYWHISEERADHWVEQNTITVLAGERVAQLVFHKICPVWDVEMDEINVDTDRGEAGFGSTGA